MTEYEGMKARKDAIIARDRQQITGPYVRAIQEFLASVPPRKPGPAVAPNDPVRVTYGMLWKLQGVLLDSRAPAALAAAPRMGEGWLPISTAPKDGTPILGFMPSYYQNSGGQSVILWMEGQWFDNRAFVTEPTHWMPLPPAPEKG